MPRFPEPSERYPLERSADVPTVADSEEEVGSFTSKRKSPDSRPTPAAAGKRVLKEQLEQVGRYVPSEVLAVYIPVCTALSAMGGPRAHGRFAAFLFVFGACFLATPFYVAKMSQDRRFTTSNQVIATIAFAVWAYAYPIGPFNCHPITQYSPMVAVAVMGVFTVFTGLFEPKPAKKRN